MTIFVFSNTNVTENFLDVKKLLQIIHIPCKIHKHRCFGIDFIKHIKHYQWLMLKTLSRTISCYPAAKYKCVNIQ